MTYNKQKISDLLDHYKKCVIINKIEPKKTVKCKYIKNDLTINSTIRLFNKIFKFLGKRKKETLFNEFVNINKNWWKKNYSRATYFRIKREVVKEFLGYFE